MSGHKYNDYRYADCRIIFDHSKGQWESYWKRGEHWQLVITRPSVSTMNRELKRMKLAKEGPWSETRV